MKYGMLAQHREYFFAFGKSPEILLFTVTLFILGQILSNAQHCDYSVLLSPGLLKGIGSGQLRGNFIGNYIAALRAGTELPGK